MESVVLKDFTLDKLDITMYIMCNSKRQQFISHDIKPCIAFALEFQDRRPADQFQNEFFFCKLVFKKHMFNAKNGLQLIHYKDTSRLSGEIA